MLEPTTEERILAVLHRHTELLAEIAGDRAQGVYRLVQSALANAGGFATILFPAFPGGVSKEWIVDRVFLYSNTTNTVAAGVFILDGAPAGLTVDQPNLFQTAIDPLFQHDFTNVAIAAGEQIKPLYVKGGEILAVQWTGLSANARCVARIQFRLAWQGAAL